MCLLRLVTERFPASFVHHGLGRRTGLALDGHATVAVGRIGFGDWNCRDFVRRLADDDDSDGFAFVSVRRLRGGRCGWSKGTPNGTELTPLLLSELGGFGIRAGRLTKGER